VRIDAGAVNQLLHSSSGVVVREMVKRGKKVETLAKRLCPVDHGRLRSDIHLDVVTRGSVTGVRIGSSLDYALYVHEGTGIYGPRGRPILPKSGRFLVFTPRGGSKIVFAKSVRGTPGKPFLTEALAAARTS
jgi:hypothetical protein